MCKGDYSCHWFCNNKIAKIIKRCGKTGQITSRRGNSGEPSTNNRRTCHPEIGCKIRAWTLPSTKSRVVRRAYLHLFKKMTKMQALVLSLKFRPHQNKSSMKKASLEVSVWQRSITNYRWGPWASSTRITTSCGQARRSCRRSSLRTTASSLGLQTPTSFSQARAIPSKLLKRYI